MGLRTGKDNERPTCLKILLAAGADPNAGVSPLGNAATGGNARLLLDAGAEPEDECEFETILDTAIINKKFDAAIALIRHGVDVRKGNPVVAASKVGMPHARFLLPVLKEAGADNCQQGLQVAAGRGNARTVRAFMKVGALPDQDAAAAAGRAGWIDCAWLFWEKNENLAETVLRNAGSDELLFFLLGRFPGLCGALHSAMQRLNLGLVRKLLAIGQDANARTEDGWTPLHSMVSLNFYNIVREDREKRDADMYPRLSQRKEKTGEEKAEEIFLALMDAGADINAGSVKVVQLAARNGWDFDPLLKHGADPKVVDGEGNTLIHLACIADDWDAVTLLLKSSIDPDAKNAEGDTSLLFAAKKAKNRSSACIHRLIEADANLDMRDKYGKTVKQIYEEAGGKHDFEEIYFLRHNGRGN